MLNSVSAQDYYVGGSWLKTDFSFAQGVDEDPGFEGRLGYQVNESFAIEGAYIDLGRLNFEEISDSGGFIDANAYAVSLVATYPFGFLPVLNLNVRTGYLWWESEADLITIAGPLQVEDDGSEFIYATGLSYQINENFELKADYNNSSNFKWISVGLNYRF